MLIRKANIYDTTDIARVHVETWRSTYRRVLSDEYLSLFTMEKRKKYWMKFINDGKPVYVVEEKSGEIIAFVVPNVQRDEQRGYVGEISALYVQDRFQRRGVGRKLIATCARLMVNNDVKSLKVWVLKDNPARQFYRILGGVECDARIERMDNKDYLKLAYRWDDLPRLIELADIPLESGLGETFDELEEE